MNVSTQSFNITAPADGTKVNLGSSQQVTVTWMNNGAPVVGQQVTFSPQLAVHWCPQPDNDRLVRQGQRFDQLHQLQVRPSFRQPARVSAQLNLDFVASAPSQISVTSTASRCGCTRSEHHYARFGMLPTIWSREPPSTSNSPPIPPTAPSRRLRSDRCPGSGTGDLHGRQFEQRCQRRQRYRRQCRNKLTGNAQLTVGGQSLFLSFGTGAEIDVKTRAPRSTRSPTR